MKIPMTPGTVRLAEELTIQRAAEHMTNAIASLALCADYAGMLSGEKDHAHEAKLRIDAYLAAGAGIEKIWTATVDILQRVGNLEEEVAQRVAAAEAARPADPIEAMTAAHREAVAALTDQHVAASAAAGNVSLCCPVCRTGRWVADGVCAACGAQAVDLVKIGNGEPGVPPTAEPPSHGGTVVPIQKRDRR